MLSHHGFDCFSIGVQLVHIRGSHHDNDIVQKHFLVLGTQIVKQLFGFL